MPRQQAIQHSGVPELVPWDTVFGWLSCRLFKTDAKRGAAYHNRQVELYAEHEPECLLMFLRSSENINWKAALQICRAKSMIREQVFVMGRMGDTHNALKLIMTKLGDVKEVTRPQHPSRVLSCQWAGWCFNSETPSPFHFPCMRACRVLIQQPL